MDIWKYIGAAMLAGLTLGVCRNINARLSKTRGPLKASFWNHLVGFILLIIIIAFFFDFSFIHSISKLPWYYHCGGMIGLIIVALSSWVITHIGATRSILFIISGQMVTASIIDIVKGQIKSIPLQVTGVALIIVGVIFTGKATSSKKSKSGETGE